jgi:hypothetical protein
MLVAAALVLFVVCMLTSVTSQSMFAQAADQSITLFPNQGLPDSKVVINGNGFSAGVPVTITFNGETVATTQGYGFYSQLSIDFRVPDVDFGTYEVKASSTEGSATATFTVGNPDSTATPTESPTDSVSDNSPTDSSHSSTTARPRATIRPTESADNSPYIIAAVVVVAVLIVVPLFFVMRGRSSRRDSLLDRDREPLREPTPFMSDRYTPHSRPGSSYGSSSSRYNPPPTYGRYGTRPASSSRYGQSSYSQPRSNLSSAPRTYGKTCPNCKKTIRTDYRVCPYCYKKV